MSDPIDSSKEPKEFTEGGILEVESRDHLWDGIKYRVHWIDGQFAACQRDLLRRNALNLGNTTDPQRTCSPFSYIKDAGLHAMMKTALAALDAISHFIPA